MLKKLLASVGIGKAKIDTILLQDQLRAGQDFNIEIIIKGGDVEQELNGIELAVMASAKAESSIGEDEVEYNKSWNDYAVEFKELSKFEQCQDEIVNYINS